MSAKLISAGNPQELAEQVQKELDNGFDLYLGTVVSRSSEGVYRLSQWMIKARALDEYRLLAVFDAETLEKQVVDLTSQGFDLHHNHFYFDVYICQWLARFATDEQPATVTQAQAERPNYVTHAMPLPWPIVNCKAVFGASRRGNLVAGEQLPAVVVVDVSSSSSDKLLPFSE